MKFTSITLDCISLQQIEFAVFSAAYAFYFTTEKSTSSQFFLFFFSLCTQGRSKRIIKLCYKVKWMRIFCLYPVPIECESNKNISKHADDGKGDIAALCAVCIATKTTEFRYFFLFLFHFFSLYFIFFFEVKIWIMHVKIFALVLCLQFLVIITRQKNCRFRNGWYGTRGGVFYRQHQPAEGGKKINKGRNKHCKHATLKWM